MKEELKYKDIDSNTIAGVRNVNDLGKTFNYTSCEGDFAEFSGNK